MHRIYFQKVINLQDCKDTSVGKELAVKKASGLEYDSKDLNVKVGCDRDASNSSSIEADTG